MRLREAKMVQPGPKFTHRPTDLDSWATQCRMVQERFPQSALSQFPSDFKKKPTNKFQRNRVWLALL